MTSASTRIAAFSGTNFNRHGFQENLRRVIAYMREQAALREIIPTLTEQVRECNSGTADLQHFLKRVRRYTQPEKLTPAMPRELVEKAVVYAPDKRLFYTLFIIRT